MKIRLRIAASTISFNKANIRVMRVTVAASTLASEISKLIKLESSLLHGAAGPITATCQKERNPIIRFRSLQLLGLFFIGRSVQAR